MEGHLSLNLTKKTSVFIYEDKPSNREMCFPKQITNNKHFRPVLTSLSRQTTELITAPLLLVGIRGFSCPIRTLLSFPILLRIYAESLFFIFNVSKLFVAFHVFAVGFSYHAFLVVNSTITLFVSTGFFLYKVWALRLASITFSFLENGLTFSEKKAQFLKCGQQP